MIFLFLTSFFKIRKRSFGSVIKIISGIYGYLDTLELLKKFRGMSDIFDVFMTSSMSDIYVILQFLATASVIEFVETLDFHIEYVS